MILSYNWQILDKLVRDQQELQDKVYAYQPLPEDSFNTQEEANVSVNSTLLRQPHFGFLFCYRIQQPKHNPPEIELQTTISLCEVPVRHKVIKNLKTKACIYLEIEIQNTQIYQTLMTLLVKIRYHVEEKLQKIHSIDQVVRLASQRQINLYTATTYSTIKRDIMVESPVGGEWRQEKQGYLYLKLSKSEQYADEVEILEVEVMNWLSQREEIRREVVKNLLKGPFKLKAKESYGLLFQMQNQLIGSQIPYYLKYRFGAGETIYKMVKYINLFEYK